MVWPEYSFLILKESSEELKRSAGVAGLACSERDVVARTEGSGVILTQHPLHVREKRVEQPQRLAGVAHPCRERSDIVADREGARAIRTKYALLVRQQCPK